MKKSDKLKKELFAMVYMWGRSWIVVDHTAPAFSSSIKEIGKALEDEKWDDSDHLAQEYMEGEIGNLI